MGNYSTRTQTESDAILTLATETMAAIMTAGTAFTALDISNVLKARRFPVRHREVSAVVRGLWAGDGMTAFGYQRSLIRVSAASGDAQAYLYHHQSQTPANYANDAQVALPPVAVTDARALDDAVPAGAPLSPLAQFALGGMVGAAVIHANGAAATRPARSTGRGAFRRDGAVAVPRHLIEEAGYQDGDLLVLTHDAQTRTLILAPCGHGMLGAFVRVWGDLRVRITKTKWRLAGFSGQVTPVQPPAIALDGGYLRIAP